MKSMDHLIICMIKECSKEMITEGVDRGVLLGWNITEAIKDLFIVNQSDQGSTLELREIELRNVTKHYKNI